MKLLSNTAAVLRNVVGPNLIWFNLSTIFKSLMLISSETGVILLFQEFLRYVFNEPHILQELSWISSTQYTVYYAVCMVVLTTALVILTSFVYNIPKKLNSGLSSKWLEKTLNADFTLVRTIEASQYVTSVVQETSRFANNIVMPIFNITNRILMLVVFMIIFAPSMPIQFLFFAASIPTLYLILLLLFKDILKKNSKVVSDSFKIRYALANNFLLGIDELKVNTLGENRLKSAFDDAGERLFDALKINSIIPLITKYTIELVLMLMFCITLGVSTFDIAFKAENFAHAFIIFRIINILQQLYSNYSLIAGNKHCLNVLMGLNASLFCQTPLLKDENLPTNDTRLDYKLTIKSPITISGKEINVDGKMPLDLFQNPIAFVGASGSGKSTLVYQIMGLIPPANTDSIQITSNNFLTPISLFSKNISYCSQNGILFNGTIWENVSLFNDFKLNKRDFEQFLSHHNFFELLKMHQDQTLIGDKGANLSGGQSQLIRVVRCMFSSRVIKIYDEPTSSMDPEMKELIFNLIYLDRTSASIVITHDVKFISKFTVVRIYDDDLS
jgi:ABC-type multidrug transport system fused ATPase/permease subunit